VWGKVVEIKRKTLKCKILGQNESKTKKIKGGNDKTWLENVWMQIEKEKKRTKKKQSDPKTPVDPGES
jgi:hypothetical protein